MAKSPIDSRGRVSDSAKSEVAARIAARLRQCADGPLADPDTWRRHAGWLGVHVVHTHVANGRPGFSVPRPHDDSGIVGGVIGVNLAYPEREQCAVWVHELAHLYVAAWLPPQLHDYADYYGYDDDAGSVSHDIARMVEADVLS